MANYQLFPSITPEGDDETEHPDIPHYWEFDWDQLRAFASGISGVNGKGKKEEIMRELDEHYNVPYGMASINGDDSNDSGRESGVSGASE